MKTPPLRTERQEDWPRKVRVGRVTVTVYRRITPNGSPGYLVSNYANGKRRLDSYSNEADALDAAKRLARQLSTGEVVAASLTNEQAAEYSAAVQKLAPTKTGLLAAASAVADALKHVDDVASLVAAAKFYAARQKHVTAKRVAEAVAELVALKSARGKSERYIRDLRSRLACFADAFQCDCAHVQTADVQAWLDRMKLAPRSVRNYRNALATLFSFAESRGYLAKGSNPIADTEQVTTNGDGKIEIFTPAEVTRLLACAPADFLPLIALGAFAGLRSAEALRLEWADVDLAGGFITVGSDKSKTRSRRLVPIALNLAQWLAPYAQRTGKVWAGGEREFKRLRRLMLAQSGVKWKDNALRHSFISYRVAQAQDAARVSLEAGNSPQMIFRHYRELVKPADAERWFNVKPETPANVLPLAATASN